MALKHDGMIVRTPGSLLLALMSKFYFAPTKYYTVYLRNIDDGTHRKLKTIYVLVFV